MIKRHPKPDPHFDDMDDWNELMSRMTMVELVALLVHIEMLHLTTLN